MQRECLGNILQRIKSMCSVQCLYFRREREREYGRQVPSLDLQHKFTNHLRDRVPRSPWHKILHHRTLPPHRHCSHFIAGRGSCTGRLCLKGSRWRTSLCLIHYLWCPKSFPEFGEKAASMFWFLLLFVLEIAFIFPEYKRNASDETQCW